MTSLILSKYYLSSSSFLCNNSLLLESLDIVHPFRVLTVYTIVVVESSRVSYDKYSIY